MNQKKKSPHIDPTNNPSPLIHINTNDHHDNKYNNTVKNQDIEFLQEEVQ